MTTNRVQEAIYLDKKIDRNLSAKLPKCAEKVQGKLNDVLREFTYLEEIEWEEYVSQFEIKDV